MQEPYDDKQQVKKSQQIRKVINCCYYVYTYFVSVFYVYTYLGENICLFDKYTLKLVKPTGYLKWHCKWTSRISPGHVTVFICMIVWCNPAAACILVADFGC